MDIFKAGQSYEADLLAQANGHSRKMQWVALVATFAAVAFAAAFLYQGTQHTVTAHVVKVDRNTGSLEVVSVSNIRDISMQGIEAMATVRHYVTARERYNYGIVQADYNEVVAMADPEVAQAYDRELRNPQGKLARFQGTIEEKVEIVNVTLPPAQVGRAVVRFLKTTTTAGRNEPGVAKYYLATLAYRFTPSPVGRKETLLLNPLGFKVSSYVVEQELNR